LPRLPDTRFELISMAEALAADPAKALFLGKAANEQNVETLDLAHYRIVAFSTHGLIPGAAAVRAWLEVHCGDAPAIHGWDKLLKISDIQDTLANKLLKLAMAVELVPRDYNAVKEKVKDDPDLIAPVMLLLEEFDPNYELARRGSWKRASQAMSFEGELLLKAAQGLVVHELGKRDHSAALQRILSIADSDRDAESLIKILVDAWPLSAADTAFSALTELESFVANHYTDNPLFKLRTVADARKLFALRLAHWSPEGAVALVQEEKDSNTRELLLKQVIETAMESSSDNNADWVWWSEIADTITGEDRRADTFRALLAGAKRTRKSATAALPELVGRLSTGPRRSFIQCIRDIAETAAVAEACAVPHMLHDLERVSAWFSGKAVRAFD
jgi:hypothetical protein